MGTPEFAVASLDALVQAGCNIVGVITAHDKPAGRGMELQQSAVKRYALKKGLHILQPEKLKDPNFLQELQVLKSRCTDSGGIQDVARSGNGTCRRWELSTCTALCCRNTAAPPPSTGQSSTVKKKQVLQLSGCSIKIDMGNILLQQSFAIGDEETAGELHDRMMVIGANLLLNTIKALAKGELTEQPQGLITPAESSDAELKHAPKINNDTCQITWNKPMAEVYNLIRGLSPYPTAFTYLEGKKIKIFRAEKVQIQPAVNAGELETDKKNFLHFACSDGYISIIELQLEGKKKLKINEFLRGYRWMQEQ